MAAAKRKRKPNKNKKQAMERLIDWLGALYIYIYLLLSAANKLDHVLSLLIVNGNKEPCCNGRKDCGGSSLLTYLR